jgi:hypothetical protein
VKVVEEFDVLLYKRDLIGYLEALIVSPFPFYKNKRRMDC